MKISVIGGGSSYTPELVSGLIERANTIGLETVSLHDIDVERLETVAGFCRRMAVAQASGLQIKTTTELARALDQSDYVIVQLRAGGNAARREDERLGRRHGLIGQETTGVGGFAKSLRTIPVMLELARELTQRAPHAALVNFTNPSGLVTEALLKHSRVRAIGLCNIPITFQLELARALSARREELELDYVGLNHLSWVRRVKLRGEDITDKVLALNDAGRPANLPELQYPPGFLRALGMIPMHYLRYYYLTGRMLEEQSQKERTRADEVMAIEQELMKIYADPAMSEKPDLLSRRGGAHYSRAALELIEAIHFDRGVTLTVNVMNRGAIPDLAAGSVVEVPCRVDKSGAHPLPTAPLEPEIRGLVQAVKSFEELTIAAAVEGSYEKALLALAVHPLGPSADRAEEALDDIIATHGIELGKS